MLSFQHGALSLCATSLCLRKYGGIRLCFAWQSVCCQSFSAICEFILLWWRQIRSVLPSERWIAPSVLADIVVWVSESGLGWWITLLMILAWERACFKKADIRRVSLSFIRCYGLVELCVELFFDGPKSTLDYLMFLFYKPGLICRAKKQEIQLAGLIWETHRGLDFFYTNKTCRLNVGRLHRNIICRFTFEMFACTVPPAEDVLRDWAHPDCSVVRERAP